MFKNKVSVVFIAIAAMFSWGCAFPFVKLGMQEFLIEGPYEKILFAGVRFLIAGIVTLVIAKAMGRSVKIESGKECGWLLLYGIVNTAVHYAFFYIGLSNCEGSKSSMIDSLGTFWLILLACLIFKERFTWKKGIGCLLVLAGIVVTNLGGSFGGAITFTGDGFLVFSTICSAFGGILTRVITKKKDVIVVTGYGLLSGGAMLILAGICGGARFTQISTKGIGIMVILVAISIVGFVLYNQLIRWNPVGQVAIYNGLIPVFGTLMSCLVLGEFFYTRYIIALVLIAGGIYVVNKE